MWRLLWDFFETFGMTFGIDPLGPLAPFVFGKMIGRKGKRIR